MKFFKWLVICGGVFGIAATLGGLVWFEFTPPEKTCVTCHEIRGAKEAWSHSAHTNVSCKACHGGTVESIAAMCDNANRAFKHIIGKGNGKKRLTSDQIERLNVACGECHKEEYAGWKRTHGSPVSKFLTDEKHNMAWKPADNCLKCHGMYLEGNLNDIISREGLSKTWTFRKESVGKKSAVPCIACHQMHSPDSLAFYSRADEMRFLPNELFSQKIVTKAGKKVWLSSDVKQNLCRQCHAANAEGVVRSGDDRTPMGKHEGISCLACHKGHSMDAKKSCGSCHEKCVLPKNGKKLECGVM